MSIPTPPRCPTCGAVRASYIPTTPYPAPAAPPPPAPRTLRPTSVPQVLLGLGALCLLVAAVTFLAVAWSFLGVGGRTAVLLALTLAALSSGSALASRRLRTAAEALTSVGLGLVGLDAVGARTAGWLGDLSDPGALAVVGASLALAGLGLTLRRPLASPQVATVLGSCLLLGGVCGVVGHERTVAAAAVVVLLTLSALGRSLGASVLRWGALAAASVWWAGLTLAGLGDVVLHPSLNGLWREGHAAALLASAALALVLRRPGCAAAASILTLLAVAPALDEGATTATVALLAATVLWTVAAWAAGRVAPSWRTTAVVPMLLSSVQVGVTALALTLAALGQLLGDVPVTDTLTDPLLLVPALLALVGVVFVLVPGRAAWARIAVVAGWCGATATLALEQQPAGLVTGLLVLGAVGLVADGRRRSTDLELHAGLAVAVLATWVAGPVVGLEPSYRAIPVLLLVGLVAAARPLPVVEVGAWSAGALASAAALGTAPDLADSLALHLTLAGALLTISALVNPQRRALGWVGGTLLTLATWVRLAELGVQAPEAYTLPSAVALTIVGLVRMHRSQVPTATALAPGLLLATGPSLLWLLATDPVTPRAALLGGACLALVLGGTGLRWHAPIVIGAVVGGVLVLCELAPYAGAVPQWVLIGLAGAALTVVGVTWEHRLRDLHHASTYLARLR